MEETNEILQKYNELKELVLNTMEYIKDGLVDINAIEFERNLSPDLVGRKCAFVEILERLMTWSDAKDRGYDWNVETEFPV